MLLNKKDIVTVLSGVAILQACRFAPDATPTRKPTPNSAPSSDTDIFAEHHHKTLTLGYQDFDQDMGGGWRLWGEVRGDEETAVRLIEIYLDTNVDLNDNQQLRCGSTQRSCWRYRVKLHARSSFSSGARTQTRI